MRVLLTTAPGIIAASIRALTWSDYSHADIVDGSYVIGAYPGRGVERVPLAQRLREASRADFFNVPNLDECKAIATAMTQLGKPYDWAGVIGIGLHRDWQQTDKWFCSELVAWVAQECGWPLLHCTYRRVTPQLLIDSPHLYPIS